MCKECITGEYLLSFHTDILPILNYPIWFGNRNKQLDLHHYLYEFHLIHFFNKLILELVMDLKFYELNAKLHQQLERIL